MFKNQPKGLFALALANTGERFGYYTMLAIFMLFLQAKFGWEQSTASQVYSIFLAAVYFMWQSPRRCFGATFDTNERPRGEMKSSATVRKK